MSEVYLVCIVCGVTCAWHIDDKLVIKVKLLCTVMNAQCQQNRKPAAARFATVSK